MHAGALVLQPALGYHPTPAEPHQYTSTHRNRTIHPHTVASSWGWTNNIRNMLRNKNFHKVTSSWFNLFKQVNLFFTYSSLLKTFSLAVTAHSKQSPRSHRDCFNCWGKRLLSWRNFVFVERGFWSVNKTCLDSDNGLEYVTADLHVVSQCRLIFIWKA